MTASAPRLDGVQLHPAELVRRWRAEGWWTGETFPRFLDARLKTHAARPAVVGMRAADRADRERRRAAGPVRLSYRELDRASAQLGHALAGQGIRQGSPVLLHLPNTVEFVVAVVALLRAGALPVFSLDTHREPTLAALAESCGARHVLVAPGAPALDPDALGVPGRDAPGPALVDVAALEPAGGWAAAAVDALPPVARPVDSGTTGLLQLSGGTTGTSKLIPRTHDGYLLSVRESARICGLDTTSALLVALPAAHNFPMSSPGILGALDAGSQIVLAPDPSPGTGLRLCAEHGVTHLSLVPPLARSWAETAARRGWASAALQVVGIGGARLAPTVAAEVERALGVIVQQVFGMAEGLVNYTRLDDPEETRLHTQGRPLCAADEVRVVDETGAPVPDGVRGSLETRGPYTICRYLGDTDRERSAFTDDGFYRTGDLVLRRPDGNLEVLGRSGDLVNRAGEKIPVGDLEDLLLAHPDVHDAVAVGLPDETLGEQLVVAVTVRDEDDERSDAPSAVDLRAKLRDHLREKGAPAHWLPDRTVVLDRLPVTGVGKNSRRDLREAVTAALRGDTPTPTTEETP